MAKDRAFGPFQGSVVGKRVRFSHSALGKVVEHEGIIVLAWLGKRDDVQVAVRCSDGAVVEMGLARLTLPDPA